MDPKHTTVFDVAEVLGLGTPSTEPMPEPEAGYFTLLIPEGMSLLVLRNSAAGKELVHDQDYDQYPWSEEAPPAGTYRLRLCVPGSNGMTAAEQVAMMLSEGEELAPVALVAAALMCIRLKRGADPLRAGGWTRCAEKTAGGFRVELSWAYGSLFVNDFWADGTCISVWAAACRRID